jgi:hypothetical protein
MCTDQPANVKKTLANSEPSTHGTSHRFAATQHFGRFRSEADIEPRAQRRIYELQGLIERALDGARSRQFKPGRPFTLITS